MFSATFEKPVGVKTKVQLVYNLNQTCGWFYVAYLMMISFASNPDALLATETFPAVGSMVVLLCQLSFLEIPLAVFKIIPSSVVVVLAQLIARNIVILVTVNRHPSVQSSPAVFLFVLAWTLTETVRFPWLMFKTLGTPPYILSYIRYASPVLLYPLGAVGEFWSMYNAHATVGATDVLLSVQTFNLTLNHIIQYIYFPLFVPGFLYLWMNAVGNFKKQSKRLNIALETKLKQK